MKPPRHEILSSPDGTRVWVNGPDGSSIGRFSKRFGIDVHTTAQAQMEGAKECLHCTHGAAGPAEWTLFREKMKEHYAIDIPVDLIKFGEQEE